MKTVYDRMMENDSYQKTKDFIIKQKWPYPQKKAYAEKIAWEFYQHPDVAGRCYVTVGGLDSITLFLFLRSIGINVPAVSVSSLEDKSIQLVHKALGIRSLPPIKDENGRPYTKMRVIQQYGYPVISKEAAQKISHLQNPTSKNATVRHAIMTGETGEYGGFKKNSRMKMSQKWLEKFGGPENENEGTNYQTAPFKVSDACCYYLKERPCDLYAKETKCFPYENKDTGKREIFVAQDSSNINQWGVLQYYEKLDSTTNAKAMADALLSLYNTKTRTLKLQDVLGDIRVRAGTLLVVMLGLGDINVSN